MSVDDSSGLSPVDHWEDKLSNLRKELEKKFREDEDFNYEDFDLSLSEYSIRELGGDEGYVLSTPGKVYLLGNDPVGNPNLKVHERGNKKEGYSEADQELEELIEEELEG